MRLLNTKTLELESFHGSEAPTYAILSHTWGEDEVLFEDVQHKSTRRWRGKVGAPKVLGAAKVAIGKGYGYLWVDSCCIDKASSAELSEAINSMYKWYEQSVVCFAYLFDVRRGSFTDEFPKCHWFTRGWTREFVLAFFFFRNGPLEITSSQHLIY
jgi:hypothetical protein